MSEERIKALENNHTSMLGDVRALQQSVTKLVISLESHADDERDLENSINTLNLSINELRIQFVASPIERNREVHIVTEPIWSAVRKVDAKIQEGKYEVTKELRKEYKTLAFVMFVAYTVTVSMGSYIFFDMKDDMVKDHTSQSAKIESFIRGVNTK